MANDLIVRILGDTKGLERSFAKANQATVGFGRSIDGTAAKADKGLKSMRGFATGAATGFAGAVALGEATRQIGAAVDVASNLQEQLSKSNIIFEDSAKVIEGWSKTTAESIGIARDEAVAAAATFGTIFTAAGRSTRDAAELSKSVVQLAADLASFNNTSVEDSLTALRSGLSGEIEPLRRFQVFLTEAAVAQEAMAQSGKRSAKELTQGEKILARYALIIQQTSKQSGDFERTQDGLANKQRVLQARTRDLQASLGRLLLPAMTELVEVLNDATSGALLLASGLQKLGSVKIPKIEIPFIVTIGGQSIGDLGGKAFNVAKFTPLNPLFGLTIANAIAQQLRDQAEAATPDLSKALQDASEKMVSDALGAVKPFGITELPNTGDTLSAQFATGIDNAINSAQALAKTTVAEGKERIAADKAKVAAEKAREALEKRNEALRKLEEARRAAVQRSQFRALGLSGEGAEVVPGVENLRKQLDSLTKRLAGSDVKSKLTNRLEGVRKLLTGQFGKVTEETRAAIRDLFDGIRQEFDKGADNLKGPRTVTSSLNANKILDGLGLGREAEKELRARLSSFNSAGRSLGGATRPTGNFQSQPIVVENNNTINVDGDTIARSTTKSQQKQKRRNPRQKRGPNSRSGI